MTATPWSSGGTLQARPISVRIPAEARSDRGLCWLWLVHQNCWAFRNPDLFASSGAESLEAVASHWCWWDEIPLPSAPRRQG
jgi:hypothetical protein